MINIPYIDNITFTFTTLTQYLRFPPGYQCVLIRKVRANMRTYPTQTCYLLSLVALNDANQCAQIAVLKERKKGKGRDIYMRYGML